MNIFCFWTAVGGVRVLVAASSAEEGVDILKRLGINDVKVTDYNGESAAVVVTDSTGEVLLSLPGYFRPINDSNESTKYELINDNGEIV